MKDFVKQNEKIRMLKAENALKTKNASVDKNEIRSDLLLIIRWRLTNVEVWQTLKSDERWNLTNVEVWRTLKSVTKEVKQEQNYSKNSKDFHRLAVKSWWSSTKSLMLLAIAINDAIE